MKKAKGKVRGLELVIQMHRFSMSLLGPFKLEGPGGVSFGISSRKGIALLAMLATSPNGERMRGWLQERLWGSRGETQASASLRRELSNLRKGLEQAGFDLIDAEGGRIRLRIESVDLDIVRQGREGWVRAARAAPDAEFLEGLDIRGEEGFESWLTNFRSALSNAKAEVGLPTTPRETAGKGVASDFAAMVLLAPLEEHNSNERASNQVRAFYNELVSQLVRLRWLRVVSQSATAPDGSRLPDSYDDEEASYLIERAIVGGSQSEHAEIRLLRFRSREMLFAEQMSVPRESAIVATAARVVARCANRIEREEQNRAVRLPENGDDFWNLIWRGRWHVNRLTSRDASAAEAAFDRALELFPNHLEALIEKANALVWGKWTKRSPREEFQEISNLARRIRLLDPDQCRGYWLAAIAEIWLGNLTTGVALLRHAIEIAPSFEPAHAQLGTALNLLDRPQEALETLTYALTLSPNDTHLFFRYSELAISCLQLRRWDDCIDWVDRSLILRPNYWYAQTVKIHALVQAGDWEGASRMGEEFRRLNPNFNQNWLEWIPFSDRGWVKRLCASLQIATDGAVCDAR